MTDFQLSRNAFGQLVFVGADGSTHEGVHPVRAFPIAAPDSGIAVLNQEGRELAWIEQLSELPEATRTLLEQELAQREFMPELRAILAVSSYTTPSIWQVETDRGATSLTLKGEEDIRRLNAVTLLIADSHGINFLIRDLQALDRHSRKLLDRFL